MTINQVYTILNSVIEQMQGESAVAITDLTGIIQLGKTVIADAVTKDNFLATLVDRIGKTIISQRPYSADVLSVLNDSFEYGAVLQKIYVEPMVAETSPQWGLTDGTAVDQYVVAKPTVHQHLFEGINTWQVTVTIPDIQLKSAFTSAEQMAAFIDAIYTAMHNSMEVQLEAMVNLAYCNFIGERMVHTAVSSGHTVVNLLTDYNTMKGFTGDNAASALSATDAMGSSDFLKFATKTINLYLKNMAKMSTLFNAAGYKRFTLPEYARVTVLSEFASAVTSYLESDTYHNDMVKLPNYIEVPYWQGSGETLSFDSASLVNIVTASGYDVEQDGVVCLITDKDALGITIQNRRSKSAYNNNGEYTNFFEKADMGYYNDLSENGIVFVISSAIAVPTAHEDGE